MTRALRDRIPRKAEHKANRAARTGGRGQSAKGLAGSVGMKSLQREISLLAGVSQSTVSRALRNHPALPRATCERIQSVARTLGYEGNPLLSAVLGSVRRGRGASYLGTLGYLTAHATADGWRRVATHRDFLDGAKARAAVLGFKLEPFWAADPAVSGRRMTEILQARGISALVLGSRSPENRFADLDWNAFAVVRIGLSAPPQRFHCVVNHQIHTLRIVAGELVDRGYRKIGLAITHWQNEVVEHNWLAAFLAWHYVTPGLTPVPIHLVERMERKEFLRWYRAHRPDAVITMNSSCREWLAAAGASLPDRVGFALLDWHTEHGDTAGAVQDNTRVGSAAVDIALGMLQRNERGAPDNPQLTLIKGYWRDGATVRPRPEKTDAPAADSPARAKSKP